MPKQINRKLGNKKNTTVSLMISLSFDDGWSNHLTRAVPILNHFGWKATFYVATRLNAQQLSHPEGRMSSNDWLELCRQQHEIGAHSQTHPKLNQCNIARAIREIGGSRLDLLKLGINAKTFAYPFGARNWLINAITKGCGYEGARLASQNTGTHNRYNLNALSVQPSTDLSSLSRWIEEGVQKNKWQILVFHQIKPHPGTWDISPESFWDICRMIQRSGAQVSTVLNGLLTQKERSFKHSTLEYPQVDLRD